MTDEQDKTYLIVHEDRTERKITVPAGWKVTFGPAAKGMNRASNSNYKIPMALRFYESDNKQRAIFTDVVSFRDLSIKTQIKKTRIQEKQGFMECDGKKKATIFQAKVSEWVDPDELAETPALPGPKKVEDFDVEFVEEDNVKEDII